MSHLANVLFLVGALLSPILVTKTQSLFDQLNVLSGLWNYESAVSFGKLGGVSIQKAVPLFPRLDMAKEVEFIKELMAAPKEKAAA